MAVDYENYAFSFSHAIIKLNERQFTAISNVSFDQGVERSAVYGTDRKPLKRSAGQLQLGEGSVSFSDLEEGMEFYSALGTNPSAALFSCDVTFSNANGDTRSFELLSCALSGISGDFEQGADAMGIEFPFSFMAIKVDGSEFAL
jgi:hypothetical protein